MRHNSVCCVCVTTDVPSGNCGNILAFYHFFLMKKVDFKLFNYSSVPKCKTFWPKRLTFWNRGNRHLDVACRASTWALLEQHWTRMPWRAWTSPTSWLLPDHSILPFQQNLRTRRSRVLYAWLYSLFVTCDLPDMILPYDLYYIHLKTLAFLISSIHRLTNFSPFWRY
jgi:hypothetical protein